ncbi:2-dehydro-3-deoxygalactonokinase [Hafnia paralvei]|uniref:2-dehydro-3-deoxygalactonokinase n=1 Tax=Hafnia paralvei TaxID=546367 RepID=UPI001FFFBB68|nr:2-dehydro-3-deoxygalactonokinase [Hafnia paralvei]MCK2181177.1 2-dehydro-3-deoxygalactonokinase [Hafnia paralvei]
MNNYWIAIDWGTSNFRAFLMNNNQCIDTINAHCGLLSVPDRQFDAALLLLITPWLMKHPNLPILMAGMVGSQQGWQEVPYVALPASYQCFAQQTAQVTTSWGSPCRIVAGASGANAFGLPDVMRGEEVQLIGLAAQYSQEQHLVILPGTHSKHATIAHDHILHFNTFMTGEIYAVMLNHSLLGRDLPESDEDHHAFALGVQNAQKAPNLSNALFSARTLKLDGSITPAQVASYLSGLLIGSELSALPGKQAWIVGSATLTERYTRAASLLGITLTPANGDDCFIHGMNTIYQSLTGALA